MRKTERDFKPHLSNFCNSTDFSLANNNARHTVYLSFPTVLSRCPFTTPQHSCLSDCQSMTLSAGTWLWERKAACPWLSPGQLTSLDHFLRLRMRHFDEHVPKANHHIFWNNKQTFLQHVLFLLFEAPTVRYCLDAKNIAEQDKSLPLWNSEQKVGN